MSGSGILSGLCWLRGRGVCLGGGVLRHGVGIFAVLWCCYLWSTPRAVVLEDDGLFILAAYFNGVAHPPGYPLYTLLGKWATLFPVGSVAFRVHALSGFFAALSGVCVGWLVWRYGALSWGYAWFAALALGFSPVFWSQAIVAEVYTLNVFFVLLLLCLCLRFVSVSVVEAVRMLPWLGVVYGLALSNHWPLLLLSTPGGLCVLWSRWRLFGLGFLRFLPGVLLGLLPYVWMVWRSWQGPVVSFYGPITSMQEFWFVVGRRGYAEVDHSASAGIVDKLRFVGFAFSECMRQFSWVGGVLVVLGAVRQWWLWPRGLCLGLSGVFLGCTVLLPVFLGFDYDLMRRLTFRVYPLPAWAVAALWLALGTRTLSAACMPHRDGVSEPKFGTRGYRMAAAVRWALPVLLLGALFLISAGTNYRRDEQWVSRYVNFLLDTLPDKALLFASHESSVGPLAYQHLIEGVRPDIDFHHAHGLILGSRFCDRFRAGAGRRQECFDALVEPLDRPIYYLPETGPVSLRWGADDLGLYFLLRKDYARHQSLARPLPEAFAWLSFLHSYPDVLSPGAKFHRQLQLLFLCSSLVRAQGARLKSFTVNQLRSFEQNHCRYFEGKLALLEALMQQGVDDAVLDDLFYRMRAHRQEALTRARLSRPDYLRGEYLRSRNRFAPAVLAYRRSIRTWPHPDNEAHAGLQRIPGQVTTGE